MSNVIRQMEKGRSVYENRKYSPSPGSLPRNEGRVLIPGCDKLQCLIFFCWEKQNKVKKSHFYKFEELILCYQERTFLGKSLINIIFVRNLFSE